MKLKNLLLPLLALFLSACGSVTVVLPTNAPATAQETFTPVVSLPDLVVTNVYLGMQGVPGGTGNCVPNYGPYEIRVTLQNLGSVPVYNISVVESSTGTNLTVGELAAWGVMELYFPATSPTGTYIVTVDEQNLIPESNESNNVLSYLAPTPTPPALCSPTPPPFESTPVPSPVSTTGSESLSQGTPLIVWQSSFSPCRTASFWSDRMSYGSCPPSLAPLSIAYYPDYASTFTSRYSIWAKAYAPFTAQTSAGAITFNGYGYVIPTEAEQRMIAEWALYMFSEIPQDTGLSGGGMPISAHFSGDNRCFDLAIYRDGRYRVESCLPGYTYPAPNGYLDASALPYFYRWADHLDTFQEVTASGTWDFINIFRADGLVPATVADKVSIETLIQNVEWTAHAYASGGGLPPAAYAARKVLSKQLGLSLDQIQIKGVENMDYSDSCLGAPQPNEVCTQGITPGLRIQLVTQGVLYEFHTDTAGYDLRQFGGPQPAPQGGG